MVWTCFHPQTQSASMSLVTLLNAAEALTACKVSQVVQETMLVAVPASQAAMVKTPMGCKQLLKIRGRSICLGRKDRLFSSCGQGMRVAFRIQAHAEAPF